MAPPSGRQPFPICAVRGTAFRKCAEGFPDFRQWNADALRDSDEGDASKRVSLVSTLVAAGPATDDEAFSFVEMQGRDGDTAALGELAGRKFLGFPRRHLHGDYRSVARWRVAWR